VISVEGAVEDEFLEGFGVVADADDFVSVSFVVLIDAEGEFVGAV
jgi:hypothetical protein